MAVFEPRSWESPNVVRRELVLPTELEDAIAELATRDQLTATRVIWDAIDHLETCTDIEVDDQPDHVAQIPSVVERTMMLPAEKERLVVERAAEMHVEPTRLIWYSVADYLDHSGINLNGARAAIRDATAPAG